MKVRLKLLVAAFILTGTCYTINRIPLIQNFDSRFVYNTSCFYETQLYRLRPHLQNISAALSLHADVEYENTQSIKTFGFQAATLIVSRTLFQKSYIFMKTSELEAVSEAKETHSAVCGIPAPEKLPGSLNIFSSSAFHHTNSLRSWWRMAQTALR